MDKDQGYLRSLEEHREYVIEALATLIERVASGEITPKQIDYKAFQSGLPSRGIVSKANNGRCEFTFLYTDVRVAREYSEEFKKLSDKFGGSNFFLPWAF